MIYILIICLFFSLDLLCSFLYKKTTHRGALMGRAEIIPVQPDPGYAGGGN